jgi:hypothetical protein
MGIGTSLQMFNTSALFLNKQSKLNNIQVNLPPELVELAKGIEHGKIPSKLQIARSMGLGVLIQGEDSNENYESTDDLNRTSLRL